MLVAEDDAILAKDLKRKLEELNIIGKIAKSDPSFSTARLEPGLTTSCRTFTRTRNDQLIRADLSKLEQIKEIINSDRERYLCNLNRCFGLPAYWINPQIAR